MLTELRKQNHNPIISFDFSTPRFLPGFWVPRNPNRPLWNSELWAHLEYLSIICSKLAHVHGTPSSFTIIDMLRLFEAANWLCIETGVVHSRETPLTIKIINPHGRVVLSNLRPMYRPGSTYKSYPIARPRRFYDEYEGPEAAGRVIEVIEWGGEKYETWEQAARAAGTNVDTIKRRISQGYQSEADVPARKPRQQSKPKAQENESNFDVPQPAPWLQLIEWNGVKYDTWNAAAKAVGVQAITLKRRIRNGKTCDADMVRGTPVTWEGTRYPSIRAAAKALGVMPETLRRWLEKRDYGPFVEPGMLLIKKPIEEPVIDALTRRCEMEAQHLNRLAGSIRHKGRFTADDIRALYEAAGWQCQDSGIAYSEATPLCVVLLKPLLHGGLRRYNLRVVQSTRRFQYPKRFISRWAVSA